MKDLAIGIDLGTTNSLAAVYEDGALRVIREDAPLVPSVVAYCDDNTVVVGEEAVAGAAEPEHTVFSVKRFMGKGSEDLDLSGHSFPFHLEAREGLWQIRVHDYWVSPQEVSAQILNAVRERSRQVGYATDRVVITVPAYFSDAQRQATRDAARLAGLHPLRIINEPTAAALAYGLNELKSGTVAVYDLGGGTFDLSVLSITDGVFRVMTTQGDTFLGGDDFDEAIMNHFLEQHGYNLADASATDLLAIRSAAKRLKELLSGQEQAAVSFKAFGGDQELKLNRGMFESLIEPLVNKSISVCRGALRAAKLKPREITNVVLVGGSTRVPRVRKEVEAYFGKAPLCTLNPDHVVGMGAAMQAAMIDDKARDMLLLDVTPLSLGLETVGGAVAKLIMRNTPIPALVKESYTTYVDNQTAIDFHVLQGERELVDDNISLARFKLRGIPPMKAGLAKVDVTFQIDADGILTVHAVEEKSGVKAAVEVVPSHGLNMDKVRDIVKDSIVHATEDFQAVSLISARTAGQSLMASVQQAIKDVPDLTDDEREEFGDLMAQLKHVLAGKDTTAIEAATDELNRATTPLADRMVSDAIKNVVVGHQVDEFGAGK